MTFQLSYKADGKFPVTYYNLETREQAERLKKRIEKEEHVPVTVKGK